MKGLGENTARALLLNVINILVFVVVLRFCVWFWFSGLFGVLGLIVLVNF